MSRAVLYKELHLNISLGCAGPSSGRGILQTALPGQAPRGRRAGGSGTDRPSSSCPPRRRPAGRPCGRTGETQAGGGTRRGCRPLWGIWSTMLLRAVVDTGGRERGAAAGLPPGPRAPGAETGVPLRAEAEEGNRLVRLRPRAGPRGAGHAPPDPGRRRRGVAAARAVARGGAEPRPARGPRPRPREGRARAAVLRGVEPGGGGARPPLPGGARDRAAVLVQERRTGVRERGRAARARRAVPPHPAVRRGPGDGAGAGRDGDAHVPEGELRECGPDGEEGGVREGPHLRRDDVWAVRLRGPDGGPGRRGEPVLPARREGPRPVPAPGVRRRGLRLPVAEELRPRGVPRRGAAVPPEGHLQPEAVRERRLRSDAPRVRAGPAGVAAGVPRALPRGVRVLRGEAARPPAAPAAPQGAEGRGDRGAVRRGEPPASLLPAVPGGDLAGLPPPPTELTVPKPPDFGRPGTGRRAGFVTITRPGS